MVETVEKSAARERRAKESPKVPINYKVKGSEG